MKNNLISIDDLSRKEIENIFQKAGKIEGGIDNFSIKLNNKLLAVCFFESSTRTRLGFSASMQKLGGKVIELLETKFTEKMGLAESEEDSLKVISAYADLIMIRHGKEDFVKELNINCPVINCGNGCDEHPSQGLIDLYTIWKEFGNIDSISIKIVGDLKNMRAAHSLILGLAKFKNVGLELVSPKSLKMPEIYLDKNKFSQVLETTNFASDNADVIYMAGFPPDRNNKDCSLENRMKYQMNSEKLNYLKKKSIILCPLPRIDEITKEVDSSVHAKYFEESKNGLYVRMALLLLLMEG